LRAQVAALYATAWGSTLAAALMAGALSALFYLKLRDPMVLVWVGLQFIQLLRHLDILTEYRRDAQAEQRSDYWASKQWRELLLHSCVWGLAPWLFMPADNLPMTVVMLLLILGLSSSGVLAVAPRWYSVLSFVVPMVLGLISALAWRGDDTHRFLAACSAVYLAVTLHFAYRQHRLLTVALHTRFEKEKLAQQLAQQMAAIQHLSEEKTRFFAAASHDLRQPLHAIVLYGAVLEKKLADRPEGVHVLRLMDAVRALGVSLDTMFDVSLLDAGFIVPDPQAMPLTPVFQQLNQVFAARAEQKGLQLRLRATPLCVKTDPHLLLRVLGNLVENAIKYTHKGGVVVLARARGQQVWIDVCDTGIGITADQLEPIFAEFYQVNNPGRDRARGLGIGLSMVRRLAVLLDHPVTVQSRQGRGSRFRLQLPADVPPAPESRHVDREVSGPVIHLPADWVRGLPGRVLLLDDEADIGEAALALFTAYGVELVVVRDEVGATDAFMRASTAKPIDALIFDYRLAEGVDGLEVAAGLRSRFDPQLPMLLVTGETTPERLSRARDMGVPMLTKPVTAETLLATLTALKRSV